MVIRYCSPEVASIRLIFRSIFHQEWFIYLVEHIFVISCNVEKKNGIVKGGTAELEDLVILIEAKFV